MLAYSGFNGFGQFRSCEHERRAYEFKDFTVDKLIAREDENILIASSWSFSAIANNHMLFLKGFLSSQPNTMLTISSEPEAIKEISACDRFCLVLMKSGKVFKLLPKVDAKLQELKFDRMRESTPARKRSIFGEYKPKKEEAFQITHIACGSNITVAISGSNEVYSIPSRIHQFPANFRVRQLLCGFEHALLLSCNGDVYSWGNGLRGQLGQDILRIEEVPTMIEALAGIKITFIAAGGWHSAAIAAFGDLYTWGLNTNGQLGLRVFKVAPGSGGIREPTVYPLPQLIDLPCCANTVENIENDERPSSSNMHVEYSCSCSPVKVFAGARHTFLQMSCGNFSATGWNAHGQLGLSSKKEFSDVFERVSYKVDNVNNFQIICGHWSTIIRKHVNAENT